jgi:type II secretory pathway component PulJ
MGLVELMVALSISAALLTATAVALNAATDAYQINQQQAILLQSTRTTMNRMLTTIRRCQLHAPDTTAARNQFATGGTVSDTGIDMYDSNSVLTIYRYDAANQRVNLVIGGNTRPMIEGVTAFQVTMQPMRSAQSVRTGGPWDLLQRASIILTVKTNATTSAGSEGQGLQTLTMSASVMPRRNTW